MLRGRQKDRGGAFAGGEVSWETSGLRGHWVSSAQAPCAPPDTKGDLRTSNSLQITGKANGEAETRWCFTRLGHKMARPCAQGRASRAGDAACSPSLCSCRWSRAAAHSGPQPSPALSHTPQGLLALHARGAHVLVFPKCSPGKQAMGGICSHIQQPTHTFGSQILNCTPAICEAPLRLNSQVLKLGSDTPRAGARSGLTGLVHGTCASLSSYTRWKPPRSLTRTAVKINGIFLPRGHCLERWLWSL